MSELSNEARAEAQKRHEAGELYDLTKSRLTTFVEGAEWAAARTVAVVAATPDRAAMAKAIYTVQHGKSPWLATWDELLPSAKESWRIEADAVLALLGGGE